MAKKIFKYRGKTIEELKALSINEFMTLLTASPRRFIKRGLSDEMKNFLEKIKKKNNVKTHLREMVILPEMVGKNILVHNGKSFEAVLIQEEMIGHRLGEFAMTRKRLLHSGASAAAKNAPKRE